MKVHTVVCVIIYGLLIKSASASTLRVQIRSIVLSEMPALNDVSKQHVTDKPLS